MMKSLDELIKEAENEPLLLLELTAAYFNMSASSKIDKVVRYNDILNELYSKHRASTPFVRSLELLTDGVASYYLTDYPKTLKNLNDAIEAFKPGMPTDILGVAHWARGNYYRSQGELDLAVENQLKAIKIINPEGYFRLTYAYVLYQLGELHVAIREFDEAKKYYKDALVIINTDKNATTKFRVNNGLGNCYLMLGNVKQAKKYLMRALEVTGISQAEEARGLCDIGKLNIEQGQLQEANDQLSKSLLIRQENNLEDASSTSMINLANVLIKQENYTQAINLLLEAGKITRKFNAKGKQILMYKLLAEAYEGSGDIETALKYLKSFDNINNEIRNKQEHEIFKLKNRQIEEQKQEVHQKNIVLKNALDEVAKLKNSRKSLIFSILTAIVLVLLTEAFFDPLIDSYAYNTFLSLGVKILIALMLKPMESLYERLLLRRALRI